VEESYHDKYELVVAYPPDKKYLLLLKTVMKNKTVEIIYLVTALISYHVKLYNTPLYLSLIYL